MNKKIKQYRNKNPCSTKGLFIRIYKPEDIEKLNEFKRLIHLENKTKPYQEQQSINDIFSKLIIDFIENKIYENSSTVIAKMILPLIKKGFKNQLDDLTTIMLNEFNKVKDDINNKFYLTYKLDVFNANVIAAQNKLRDELNNEHSLFYTNPKWIDSKT